MQKVKMPENEQKKCHLIIHGAAASAAAAATVPIPVADAIPITTIQVGMIIALGKVFDIDINDSVAKAIVSCSVAQNVGRTIASSILKLIPGINLLVAPFVNPAVASAITEGVGWLVADDFYKVSKNEKPTNILSKVEDLEGLFKNTKNVKKVKAKVTKENKKK